MQTNPKKRGRKPSGKEWRKNIGVTLSKEAIEILEKLSKESNRTRSAVVELLILAQKK